MKVKILKSISHTKTGMMKDLKPGNIMSLDDEMAEKLIDEGKAELII